ncbi:MAG: glycosyltransferase [Actinomycetes bacterium]
MRQVHIEPIAIDRLEKLLAPERAELLRSTASQAEKVLGDRVVWNINATAQGGGVAEMLQSLLSYAKGAGIDTRWLVLRGTPHFFEVTKRIHNNLHGEPGDGGPLGRAEHDTYEQVLADNLADALQSVREGDMVLLHDPQTAGLVRGLKEAGAHVVWRCHVGSNTSDEHTDAAWAFLRPYLDGVDAFIFSRERYAPEWVPRDVLWVIPPSVDPYSAKNENLSDDDVHGILCAAGLATDGGSCPPVRFTRRDGRTDVVRHHSGVLVDGGAPPPIEAPLVVQVSRWDRLKDMGGVLQGFAEHLGELPDDVHLMLAGPEVSGVSDDPEGAEVLAECVRQWRALPDDAKSRVHLACLPMDDVDENAVMVNALQRHAYVVVQKSLVEGFGLTVTEAMWKGRPVVASAVGGIEDQIEDGRDGLLIHDPRDLDELAAALSRVLGDEELADRLGTQAKERVQNEFLGDRHLVQYVRLFESLLNRSS